MPRVAGRENGAKTDPIVIVGAGIVGVATAIWLQREGREVVLIDRTGPGEGTSYGNAGVLASCSVVPLVVPGLVAKAPRMLFSPSEPLFLRWSYLPTLAPWLWRYLRYGKDSEVRRIASALYPIIGDSLSDHQALARGTGAAKRIVPSDYCYLYRDRSDFEADAYLWSLRREHGFEWEELEGAALHEYDPIFSPKLGFAARMGNHGRINDPGAYVKELAEHVIKEGGRLIRSEVTDFIRSGDRIVGVRAGSETILCSAVVLAAGVWSKALTAKLGLNVPLESERGYHLELWNPSVMPRAPMMIAAGKFVATPMEGRLRLAGIVEFGGLDAPPSRKPFEFLLNNVKNAIPGIRWEETKRWMGHRPAPVDSIPLIGEMPSAKGVWLGFGHHHVGLTGGPKTGRLLAQMISDKKPNIDMTPYAPSRFATGH